MIRCGSVPRQPAAQLRPQARPAKRWSGFERAAASTRPPVARRCTSRSLERAPWSCSRTALSKLPLAWHSKISPAGFHTIARTSAGSFRDDKAAVFRESSKATSPCRWLALDITFHEGARASNTITVSSRASQADRGSHRAFTARVVSSSLCPPGCQAALEAKPGGGCKKRNGEKQRAEGRRGPKPGAPAPPELAAAGPCNQLPRGSRAQTARSAASALMWLGPPSAWPGIGADPAHITTRTWRGSTVRGDGNACTDWSRALRRCCRIWLSARKVS